MSQPRARTGKMLTKDGPLPPAPATSAEDDAYGPDMDRRVEAISAILRRVMDGTDNVAARKCRCLAVALRRLENEVGGKCDVGQLRLTRSTRSVHSIGIFLQGRATRA